MMRWRAWKKMRRLVNGRVGIGGARVAIRALGRIHSLRAQLPADGAELLLRHPV